MRNMAFRGLGFAVVLASSTGAVALAQNLGPVVSQPAMVVPVYPELGTGIVVPAPQSPYQSPVGQSAGSPGNSGSTGSGGSSSAMALYEQAGYAVGGEAIASQLGLNAEALAGIAEAESRDTNVADANGSTSAYGVYQITQPTWNSIVSKYGLPYTAADMTNPADQTVVAGYILQNYSQSVATAINAPPTVIQSYGAWVFGAGPGSEIATASADTPLSQYVTAQDLANNGMQGWTVGEFQQNMAQRLGGTANDLVFG